MVSFRRLTVWSKAHNVGYKKVGEAPLRGWIGRHSQRKRE